MAPWGPVHSSISAADSGGLHRLRPSSYFRQDLIRLARIAIVAFMATVTLLVVTVLLYEAVLADDKVPSYSFSELSSRRKVDRVLVGPLTSTPPPANVTEMTDAATTELPPTVPPVLPPAMPRRFRDPAYFESRRTTGSGSRRRKTYYRKKPKPFRLSQKDSLDPYIFANEYDNHVQSSKNYHAITNHPKSIQEILQYLTESKSHKMIQNGLKFSGKIRNSGSRDSIDSLLYSDPKNPIGSASDPLEDFRLSGDPMEVNTALMGITTPRAIKPRPVSLMLDIYPMTDHTTRRKSRRKPSSLLTSSSNYPPSGPYYPRGPSSGELFGPSGPYGSRIPPSAMEEYAASSNPYFTRDHVARPTFVHEVRRPYHGDSHVDDTKGEERHQIKMQLNFYPKKRIRGSSGLYDRMQGGYSSSPSRYAAGVRGQHPRTSFAGTSSAIVMSTVKDAVVANRTGDGTSGGVTEPSNHRNNQHGAQPLASAGNETSLFGLVGSHGYTYELPPRLFFDEENPEPRVV